MSDMPQKMKTVKISRRAWCRGGKSVKNDPALRTSTGTSCCLGFVARACGLRTPVRIGTFGGLMPEQQDKLDLLPRLLRPHKDENGIWHESPLHIELTDVNDDSSGDLRGHKREGKIRTLMARAGLKVVFTD